MDQEMDMRNITAVNLNEEKKEDGLMGLRNDVEITSERFLDRNSQTFIPPKCINSFL